MKYLCAVLSLFFLQCKPVKEDADLIVHNATIYTVDEVFSLASALAVRDGEILAVGGRDTIVNNYEGRKVVDAGGKALVPGFIDAHCHFYELGLKQQQVDLTGTRSFDEVLERVRQWQEARQADFIIGEGWDQNDWQQKEFPHKEALDRLYPNTPVVLSRIDGHAYLVNQKALDLAGITSQTPASRGEIVMRNGQPSGILIDGPMELINTIKPELTLQSKIEALKTAEKICLDHGLTTVNDAGLNKEIIGLIDSLQTTGELQIRMYAMVSNLPDNLKYFLDRGPIKTDRLNVRAIKVYADGALGSRGAALKAPYTDHPGHYGAMVTTADELMELAKRIAPTGFQMNTHAIGDSANSVVLKTYSKVLADSWDHRWKIEHAQVVSPADGPYFESGVVPSVQPTHATSDMYWAENRLGRDRIQSAYDYKTLLEHAGRLALGTDFPVEEVSPFLTFFAAVARQDLQGYPEGGYRPEEALSREEALRGMTIWAAWSNFEEGEKGSIEVGKKADFVILSHDMMEVPVEEIPGITAEAVYLNGVKVK